MALDEIDRWLNEGMIGIKLYNQYRLSDPVQWPIVERATEMRGGSGPDIPGGSSKFSV